MILNHNVGLLGQSYIPSGSVSAPSFRSEQSALTDTLAKVIATNPSFQSVLAAALTSYAGGEEANCQAPRNNLSLDHGLKWGEHLALGTKNSNDANVTRVSQDFVTRSGPLFLDPNAPMDKSKYLSWKGSWVLRFLSQAYTNQLDILDVHYRDIYNVYVVQARKDF
jgi:hypothetical protein